MHFICFELNKPNRRVVFRLENKHLAGNLICFLCIIQASKTNNSLQIGGLETKRFHLKVRIMRRNPIHVSDFNIYFLTRKVSI